MRNLFICGALMLLSVAIQAQGRPGGKKAEQRRFKATALLGASLTQVDGDLYTGFDKFGLSGGIRGTTVLRKHWTFDIELLYQQKGSRFESLRKDEKDRILHFTYMETPFLLRYFFDTQQNGLVLEGGLVFGRKIGSKVTQNPGPDYLLVYQSLEQDFKSNELSLLLGMGVQIDKRVNLGFRYTIALSRLYDNPGGAFAANRNDSRSERVFQLRNYLIGVYAAYTFL